MCNIYGLTKGQSATRGWFRAPHDRTGNLPLFPAIFPDQLAPIIRRGPDGSATSSWRVGHAWPCGSSVDGRQGFAYNRRM